MKTNMKAAMQYQNKTPEEIVRQYKKKLRAKQGLLILIFLLYVIVGIRGIWWGDDGIADVLLKLLILFVLRNSNHSLFFRSSSSRRILSIYDSSCC